MPKFVFIPPQDDLRRRFAARLADTLPEYDVAAPQTDEEAAEEIKDADAARARFRPMRSKWRAWSAGCTTPT